MNKTWVPKVAGVLLIVNGTIQIAFFALVLLVLLVGIVLGSPDPQAFYQC